MITSLIAYRLIKIIKKDRKDINLLIHEEKRKIEEGTNVRKFEFIPLIFTGILFLIIVIIQIKEIIL